MMRKFIFTFGSGQLYQGYCQPIYAETWTRAREIMMNIHGAHWGFQYTGEQWEEMKNNKNRMFELEQELLPIYDKEVGEDG